MDLDPIHRKAPLPRPIPQEPAGVPQRSLAFDDAVGQRLPEGVFEFVQGFTAIALSKPQKATRLLMDGEAKEILEKAALLVFRFGGTT